MNNKAETAGYKETLIPFFIMMMLIFAGVCSGYYLWIKSASTPSHKNKFLSYDKGHNNEYSILMGSKIELIIKNSIIGKKGVIAAEVITNLFSSYGKLIAPYHSKIYGEFQYKTKKNGLSHYLFAFSHIVTPCGVTINLQPKYTNEPVLSGIFSTKHVDAEQKISIYFLKDTDFKDTFKQNMNVECDVDMRLQYLKNE